MKLFNLMETAYNNFDNTVSNYLSKVMNTLGMNGSHSQVFKMIYDGIKGVMQNAMFYIEDALNEQNIFTATRKTSIYSLAKMSGYEPFYGSCASGTLMRVGEGFTMQILSLAFFIIGSLIGANHMGFWELNFNAVAPKIFLPDIFGWFGALVIQLLVILLLYIAADLYEKKKMGITDEE